MPPAVRLFRGRDDLPALRRFASRVWNRPADDRYWEWWIDCPGLTGVVAADDAGELRAVIFAVERAYAAGNRRVTCLETFNWYALPEHQKSGIGLFVMRALMKIGHPLVSFGGNPGAESVHHRNGFVEKGTGADLWLPLSAEALVSRGRDPLTARVYAGTVARRLRPRPAPTTDLATRLGGAEDAPLAPGAAAQAAVPAEYLRWLASAPEPVGHFVPVVVRSARGPVSWALLRVYGPAGRRRGVLLDWRLLDASRGRDALRETLAALGGLECGAINCASSDPWLLDALRGMGFRLNRPRPCLVWSKGGNDPFPEGITLSGVRGDGAYLLLDPTLANVTGHATAATAVTAPVSTAPHAITDP